MDRSTHGREGIFIGSIGSGEPARGTTERRTWQPDLAEDMPRRFRKPDFYYPYTPEPISTYSPTLSGDLSGIVSDAETEIHALNAHAHPALAPLARLLRRTESIASSKIEGMRVGLKELARAEARASNGAKTSPAAANIIRNMDAMEQALQEASRHESFETEHIQSIHQHLMAGDRVAGRIRAEQNWIGGNDYNPCGADYVPPPPDRVDRLLADMCEAINSESLPPVVQAAIVHAQFESIHPFADGNGRTGRTLIHVVWQRRNLAPNYVPPISVVLGKHRDTYIRGLIAFREGDHETWVRMFADASAQSALLAGRYLTQVQEKQAEWRAILREHAPTRSDSAVWPLVEQLPAYPAITLSVAVTATGRSHPAVGTALTKLEDAGILTRVGSGERNRVWEAIDLLDLLDSIDA